MCTGHASPHAHGAAAHADHGPGDRAISLDHGHAHDADHAAWTRRDFLVRSALGAAAGSVLLGSTRVRAMGRSPLFDALAGVDSDRVLVLVQLTGGNDGLNTVVPVTNDLYYNARPTIALGEADTIPMGDDTRMHAALAPLASRWAEGELAVVQGVGYGTPSLSHFRSTDIWMSASDADEVVQTGWAGRTLAREFPDFLESPPEAPPAVQIGTSAPLIFAGDEAGYGMSMLDVQRFLDIAEGNEIYPVDAVPPTRAGAELGFVRGIANDAFRYRDAIQAATDAAGDSTVEYPDTDLGRELHAIATLIRGQLDTRIYHVALTGFDTHADQIDRHQELLDELAGALGAFYADLGASGDDERTLAMTFSEFGRRVAENGSDGTDHGTAAPLFVLGPAAQGGFYGTAPDLDDLDDDGNVAHAVDFRQVYATVLQRWFELTPEVSAEVLGVDYAPLALLDPPVSAGSAPAGRELAVAVPAPNPVRDRARVTYTLPSAGRARLELFDAVGRRVATLASGLKASGEHEVELSAEGLPSGIYVLRLATPGASATQRVTIVR